MVLQYNVPSIGNIFRINNAVFYSYISYFLRIPIPYRTPISYLRFRLFRFSVEAFFSFRHIRYFHTNPWRDGMASTVPHIWSLHPQGGSFAGSDPVTISGVGFNGTGSASCRFEMQTVPAVVVNSTSIECRSPAVEPAEHSSSLSVGLSLAASLRV